jgi:glycosyltransferase involved in cell wall biosynthesis
MAVSIRMDVSSLGFNSVPLSLKKRYWSLLERGRFCWRKVESVKHDLFEQVKVLSVFFWHVVLASPLSNSNRVFTARLNSPGKTLLMISYFSPPYKVAYGTERVAKLAKYLSRTGWDITLLSSSPNNPWETDAQSEPIVNEVDVARVASRDLRALPNRKLVIPDDFIGWVLPAVAQARKLMQKKNFSIVYATAPPYSNLLVGAIVSRITKRPLVSDFRDPWTKIDIFWTIERPVLRVLNRILEKAVLAASQKIVMVDEKKYGDQYFVDGSTFAHKIESISNGYDEEEFEALKSGARPRASGKFVISYVGSIYDAETFDSLVRPLELWKKQHPEDFGDVVFEYAGQSSKFFGDYPATFVIRDHGYVSHQDAIKLRSQSNLQLLAQPSSFKPHVSSGKVFEMVRVGVPILAFTNSAGAVADILSKTRAGQVVESKDFDAAARTLKQFYDEWKQGTSAYRAETSAVIEYSRENLASRFSDLLEETMQEL